MALDFKSIEEKARKIWGKNQAKIKDAVQDDKKKKLFSFLEGPPTANAPPGLHHLEVRTFKDLICKYHFMSGQSVPRKGGWDCHGLPVEVQVEKALGLNSKKDIEKYGVNKFIEKSRESVFSNIKEWNESTEELAYWIDLENPYRTLDNNYIESVWWSLKELYKKKMLYEGYKVVPYCPRCGTPLSSHEVSQGYKDITEISVYVKFELEDEPGTFLLAWTTTPWTLPGNSALYVNKDAKYVKIKPKEADEYYILAKERIEDVIKGDYDIVEEISPKKLVGRRYVPLFDYFKDLDEKYYHIDYADFVELEQGTGLVHSAIMYGEVDFEKAMEQGLKTNHVIGEDGKVLDNVPIAKGLFYKDADPVIIEDLKKRNLLYYPKKIKHQYPHCWRCSTPLLYYAINSWFIAVSKVRDKLVKNNKKINWYPDHIKDGRFGKWLEGAKDWSLSRFKYWGTPLPIWRCECGKDKVIGSVEELKKESLTKFKDYDLHRPWIDDIKLKCDCGKEMSRIPDVIDCWYDSGSASFAQFHYPFENKEEFERRFPYDFISEAIDQTRGWFYTLHVLGTLLFDKPAYKNVICAGHIVDENNEKMSKSKGNIIKPREIIDKTGVDAVRLQFCTTDVGNFKRFSYDLMRESVLPFLTVLDNTYRYYGQLSENKNTKQIEDYWILSRLNSVVENSTRYLEDYSLNLALKEIMDFVVNDFSRTYIKITRDREDTKDILGEVLEKVSLFLAPYAPYISEYIYSEFSDESVHLSKWPKADKKKIDVKLEQNMKVALEVIEKGLAERDREKIGLKWPLSKAVVVGAKIDKNLLEIVKSQLNVKDIKLEKGEEVSVKLDTDMTTELEAEGYAREVSRKVQAARKNAGLVKENRISLNLSGEVVEFVKDFKNFIMERVGADELIFENKKCKHNEEEKIKGKNLKIGFDKI